jgi:hypothetical protein
MRAACLAQLTVLDKDGHPQEVEYGELDQVLIYHPILVPFPARSGPLRSIPALGPAEGSHSRSKPPLTAAPRFVHSL